MDLAEIITVLFAAGFLVVGLMAGWKGCRVPSNDPERGRLFTVAGAASCAMWLDILFLLVLFSIPER